MRAHLLQIVDTESTQADAACCDLSDAVNDNCFDPAGLAERTTTLKRTAIESGTAQHVVAAGPAEDNAYWLGGYAGI